MKTLTSFFITLIFKLSLCYCYDVYCTIERCQMRDRKEKCATVGIKIYSVYGDKNLE